MARNLTVLAFEDTSTAQAVREALGDMHKKGQIKVDDAAVVVKEADGKVRIDNQVATGTWISTAVGGALGLLLGGIFLPLGGLVIGLAGGALVGKAMDLGVDGKFVDDVAEQIQPGTSALFLLTQDANTEVVLSALRPYKGEILQTTLDGDAEAAIKRALQ